MFAIIKNAGNQQKTTKTSVFYIKRCTRMKQFKFTLKYLNNLE